MLVTVLAQALPEGYPETIDTPRRFLQALDNPAALWTIRILLAGAFLTLLLGLWHYHRQARRDSPEEEPSVSEEKGETE